MAMTVAQAFSEFAEKLRPTQAQDEAIATRRANVERFLASAYPADSSMPLTQLRVIGSAGRKTLIRPVDDIDVFAVFDDRQVWRQYEHDSKQLLYRVRDALDGYRVQMVGARGQAVRLFYSDAPAVDITPAFPFNHWLFGSQEGFVIPHGDGKWMRTDPYVHHDFMAKRNKALENHLKPLIRLLKRWNIAHSKRLGSFHLELIAADVFGRMSGNMRLNTVFFFEHAGRHLGVKDPAGYSGNLAAALTSKQREDIERSFAHAHEHAVRAQEGDEREDVAEALRQWRIVFGDEFPACGAKQVLRLAPRRSS